MVHLFQKAIEQRREQLMLLPYEDGAGAQRGRKREEAHPFILMGAIGTSADDDRSQIVSGKRDRIGDQIIGSQDRQPVRRILQPAVDLILNDRPE